MRDYTMISMRIRHMVSTCFARFVSLYVLCSRLVLARWIRLVCFLPSSVAHSRLLACLTSWRPCHLSSRLAGRTCRRRRRRKKQAADQAAPIATTAPAAEDWNIGDPPRRSGASRFGSHRCGYRVARTIATSQTSTRLTRRLRWSGAPPPGQPGPDESDITMSDPDASAPPPGTGSAPTSSPVSSAPKPATTSTPVSSAPQACHFTSTPVSSAPKSARSPGPN